MGAAHFALVKCRSRTAFLRRGRRGADCFIECTVRAFLATIALRLAQPRGQPIAGSPFLFSLIGAGARMGFGGGAGGAGQLGVRKRMARGAGRARWFYRIRLALG